MIDVIIYWKWRDILDYTMSRFQTPLVCWSLFLLKINTNIKGQYMNRSIFQTIKYKNGSVCVRFFFFFFFIVFVFFKGQVYEWGRFRDTGSHTRTKWPPQWPRLWVWMLFKEIRFITPCFGHCCPLVFKYKFVSNIEVCEEINRGMFYLFWCIPSRRVSNISLSP